MLMLEMAMAFLYLMVALDGANQFSIFYLNNDRFDLIAESLFPELTDIHRDH